jgi:hypothetical protein
VSDSPAAGVDKWYAGEVGVWFVASERKSGEEIELVRAWGKSFEEELGAGLNRGRERR